jgi:DNA-binding GntR family transcriptional regulator
MNEPQPLYAKVKDHILSHIRSGVWAPGARVPSENELVESFGISRMTANRALRELTADGFLARVPGVGTFVREATPARSSLVELRNIALPMKSPHVDIGTIPRSRTRKWSLQHQRLPRNLKARIPCGLPMW